MIRNRKSSRSNYCANLKAANFASDVVAVDKSKIFLFSFFIFFSNRPSPYIAFQPLHMTLKGKKKKNRETGQKNPQKQDIAINSRVEASNLDHVSKKKLLQLRKFRV